jgi:hypothetical protein
MCLSIAMKADPNTSYNATLDILKNERASPELTASLLLGFDEKRRPNPADMMAILLISSHLNREAIQDCIRSLISRRAHLTSNDDIQMAMKEAGYDLGAGKEWNVKKGYHMMRQTMADWASMTFEDAASMVFTKGLSPSMLAYLNKYPNGEGM